MSLGGQQYFSKMVMYTCSVSLTGKAWGQEYSLFIYIFLNYVCGFTVTQHMESGWAFSSCGIMTGLQMLQMWIILNLKIFNLGMFSVGVAQSLFL